MENEHPSDWDPASDETRRDQRLVYDRLRRSCPVAYSPSLGWSLFRHADVMRVLLDPETFSNAVSRHLSVPHGMDPPGHTAYRRIIEPCFSPVRMRMFEPTCRAVTRKVLDSTLAAGTVEVMSAIALPFAVGAQCAFLGWPDALQPTLVDWMRRNQSATLAQDREALARIAAEFEAIIDSLLTERRKSGADPGSDITATLMHAQVSGRPVGDAELASILRNFTAGEIGTISASVGILLAFLAENGPLQAKLRSDPALLPYAIDEMLRIHGPLVMNRRVATRDTQVGGKALPAGARLSLNWISVNRDEEVFEAADEFRFGRDQSSNLLYGAGIHVCPGAPLARLELRVFMEEFLARTRGFMPDGTTPTRAVYPSSGFSSLPLRLDPALCGGPARM